MHYSNTVLKVDGQHWRGKSDQHIPARKKERPEGDAVDKYPEFAPRCPPGNTGWFPGRRLLSCNLQSTDDRAAQQTGIQDKVHLPNILMIHDKLPQWSLRRISENKQGTWALYAWYLLPWKDPSPETHSLLIEDGNHNPYGRIELQQLLVLIAADVCYCLKWNDYGFLRTTYLSPHSQQQLSQKT